MGVTGSLATAATDAGPASLVGFSVAVVLLTLFVYEFRSWYRLRHVPGPFLASVSSAWMVKKALSGRFHEHLRDAAEQYGKDALSIAALVSPQRTLLIDAHHRLAGTHWAK
jgi:hypothetical protein